MPAGSACPWDTPQCCLQGSALLVVKTPPSMTQTWHPAPVNDPIFFKCSGFASKPRACNWPPLLMTHLEDIDTPFLMVCLLFQRQGKVKWFSGCWLWSFCAFTRYPPLPPVSRDIFCRGRARWSLRHPWFFFLLISSPTICPPMNPQGF